MSNVNPGVRELFKKKQDWLDARLGQLQRPQDGRTLQRPAADQEKEATGTATAGDHQAEM